LRTGTTGESPALTHDEHKQVVEWCIAEARACSGRFIPGSIHTPAASLIRRVERTLA
jgi:dihydrodipicolinate synthase/N-acetylneuraminate lyase